MNEHQAELALEVSQLDTHPKLEQPVEVAERLVEEQRLRLRHEHARERDPLLLSAREGAGLAVGELGEADHLERVERLLAPLVLRHAMHLQAELDILEHAPVREEREVLEDRRRRPLVRRQADERLPVENDVALRRVFVPADHAQRRRLAAPGRAEQDDVLAVIDMEIDVFDGHGPPGEDLRQPNEIEP